MSVQVGPEAQPPTDVAYTESVDAGSTLNVSAADGLASQATGSGFTFTDYSAPQDGTATVNPDGSYSYTPKTDYSGHDYFLYKLTDGVGETVLQYVAITVVPPPAPTAQNMSVTTSYDTGLDESAPGILAGSTGTDLTYTGAIGPSHGTLVVNANGSYVYTPDTGYSGPDSFEYFLIDPYGQGAYATVSITVNPLQPPTAADYTATVDYNTPLTVDATLGLLDNDTGTGITVTSFTPTASAVTVPAGSSATGATAHGSVTVSSSGSYTYTPTSGYEGPDSFSYTVTDGYAETATGTVTLNVLPPPPTAPNYTETTPSKTPLVVTTTNGVLSKATGTALAATLKTTPLHGNLSFSADGKYTYTPYATFTGTDSFTYTATDEYGQTASGTVNIDVTGSETAPVAKNYTETTPFNTPFVSPASGVLANDTGTGITVTGHTAPSHGTVTIASNGSYTYTPNNNYAGTDSFTYTITDSFSQTATATVNLTVSPPAAPVANNDTGTTPFNTPLVVSAAEGVLANDTGTGITVTTHTAPSHGDGDHRQ